MKAVIIVTPKPSVFDPQGEAVCRAVQSLGLKSVTGVRIGKYIEVEVKGTPSASLRKKLESVSHDLLSNPVIEDYQLEVAAGSPAKSAAKKAPSRKGSPRAKAATPRQTTAKAKPEAPASSPAPAEAPASDWRPGDGKKKKKDKKKGHKDGKKKSKKKDKVKS